jgi:hypothetical protein
MMASIIMVSGEFPDERLQYSAGYRAGDVHPGTG